MTTPVSDFLEKLAHSPLSRFFMPGHKGKLPFTVLKEISRYDITEITGADSLFEAEGILKASEENTSLLYESGLTCFSTGGSTLCIQTMLSLACQPGDKILAGRNAHKAFVNTCVLLDLNPVFISPDYNDSFGVSGELSAHAVKEALERHPDAKALYVTSPDYLGCMSDIRAIAKLCESADLPLLVDNAHGAHLKFMKEDLHPLTLGAALCCDSAHKTLPVLTGGAYLHVSRSFPVSREQVKSAMSLFGSTSPSYLILLSLDLCNRYLAQSGKEDFQKLEERVDKLYHKMAASGIYPITKRFDKTKLTLDASSMGMSGEQLAACFQRNAIEPEYIGSRHVVLMLSPQNTEEDYSKLDSVLSLLPDSKVKTDAKPFTLPEQKLSVRKAYFHPKKTVPLSEALNQIAAETKIKCPPGVPIVLPGELIDENAQKLLKKSSISLIDVIK